jgi:hypothetical protein
MKLFLVVRAVAVALAVVLTLASLLAANPVHDRLRRLARLAVFGAIGAQIAHELDRVLGRRAPWTKLLLPLLALGVALRTLGGEPLPLATIALLGAIDVALLVFALVVAARVLRREPGTYPEEALEHELDRFTPGPINRYIATELVVMGSALRYLCGGFRRPLPAGFSYVRRWATLPLLLAIPVLTIPEMLVLDFALWRAPWWRLGSDVLHVYAMLWFVGIVATARARPHRCEPERVRLRFGCIRRLDLERPNIAAAVERGIAHDMARPAREPATMRMTLSDVPAVELELREPVLVRSLLGRARAVRRVVVSVDEPAAFAAAVAA